MAVSRAQKVELLKDLKDKMSKAQSIIFAHYIGMPVANVSALRAKLKEGKAEMKVGKKTLMQIAAKELKLPELTDEVLEGPVACIFSYEDPLSGAQIAFKFSKNNPQVELIGGVFEGKLLTKEEAVRLAKIPSKLQLLGMFAGMINTPLVSFAIGLKELAKQKEQPSVAAEAPKAEEKKDETTHSVGTPTAAAADATPATTEEATHSVGTPAAPAADAPPAA